MAVLLFKSNCSESASYYKQLEETATKGLGRWVTAKLNCTEHGAACRAYGDQPRLLYFPAGNKDPTRFVAY